MLACAEEGGQVGGWAEDIYAGSLESDAGENFIWHGGEDRGHGRVGGRGEERKGGGGEVQVKDVKRKIKYLYLYEL